jgi:exoribonuclease II
MMRRSEIAVMKAVAICHKPYLKPEEAMIYCNLGRTQLLKKCDEFGVYKNNSGYFKRDELDTMMSGAQSLLIKKK